MPRLKPARKRRSPTLGAFGLPYDLLALLSIASALFIAKTAFIGAHAPFSLALIAIGLMLHLLAGYSRAHKAHDFELIPRLARARFEQSRFMHSPRCGEKDRRVIFDGLLRTHETVVAARGQLENEAGAVTAWSFMIAFAFALLFLASASFAFEAANGPSADSPDTIIYMTAAIVAAGCALSLFTQTPASIAQLYRLLHEVNAARGVADFHIENTSDALAGDKAKLWMADYAEAALVSIGEPDARDRAERNDIINRTLRDSDPRFALEPPIARRR